MPKVPVPHVPLPVLATPLIRRVVWHMRRMGGQLDRRFFVSLGEGILITVAIAAVLITAPREAADLREPVRLVQLGDRHRPRPGRCRLRDVTRGTHGQLAAYPVRRRHARLDHRGARCAGRRLPAQGGSGFGFLGAQGAHRRVRLEQHRARPHRRAQGRRLQAEGRRAHDRRQEPGRPGCLLRAWRRDRRRGPRARRHRVRIGGARLPVQPDRRRRHAFDPDDHGDQGDRAAGAHRGRGQQPAPRAALPAGGGRRAAGHLEGRLAPARPVRAVSRPVVDRDRHRVRRRGLRAVPGPRARTSTSG